MAREIMALIFPASLGVSWSVWLMSFQILSVWVGGGRDGWGWSVGRGVGGGVDVDEDEDGNGEV